MIRHFCDICGEPAFGEELASRRYAVALTKRGSDMPPEMLISVRVQFEDGRSIHPDICARCIAETLSDFLVLLRQAVNQTTKPATHDEPMEDR